MTAVLAGIWHWAVGVGGIGLFLIALLDSSILSFPQVADALVLLQSARHPQYMLYYAGMTTLGSLAGCFALYGAGRKGGEVFLRRRFKATHVDRALALYRRFGMLVVLVPALLPPPAPLKIFVLLSGAAGLSPLAFGLAVLIGRGIRYFAQAWLAAAYGDRAADLLTRHGGEAIAALAALALIAGAVYVLWQRQTRTAAGDDYAPDPIEAAE
jgi:membrane protein YqaA with SNARE-associated domain